MVLFYPARRRLRALEHAGQRLGEGDLSARARQKGGDEIARVAAAFNRMAGELETRDAALRTSDALRRQMMADVSHELKTPLTAMRGYIETLRMPEVALDAERRAAVQHRLGCRHHHDAVPTFHPPKTFQETTWTQKRP